MTYKDHLNQNTGEKILPGKKLNNKNQYQMIKIVIDKEANQDQNIINNKINSKDSLNKGRMIRKENKKKKSIHTTGNT